MVAEAFNPFASVPRPAHVPLDRVVDWDIYNPKGIKEGGFHKAWKALQDSTPHDVVWTPCNGGHWMAIRGQSLTEVFTEFETFSSHNLIVPKAIAQQHTLLPTTLDPPEHKPYRAIINPPFTPKRVATYEAPVRRVAVELIEAFVKDGHCNFTTAYAEQLPIRIFLAMVNLPMADSAKLKYLADQVTRPDGSMTFLEAIDGLGDYIRPYIEERRRTPGDDMLSGMINSKVDGRDLTMDECVKLSVQILIAGLDTVVNFLGFTMLFLARNPAHRRQLVANPAMIPEAIEEVVRGMGVVTIAREIMHDRVFHGAPLQKGEVIAVPSMLHGIDERENPDPMTIDFGRKSRRHSGFGQGPHHCVGAPLARLELRITLEEWLKRIPEFELAAGTVIEQQGGIVGCVKAVPLVWPVAH